MTKELKEALHKVMDACIDFKAHGVDMFFEYAPHCDNKIHFTSYVVYDDNRSPFGSYVVHYHANGAWKDGERKYVDYLTDLGVDELTATHEKLKELALKFAFTLEDAE